jgi:hypothetical protein
LGWEAYQVPSGFPITEDEKTLVKESKHIECPIAYRCVEIIGQRLLNELK